VAPYLSHKGLRARNSDTFHITEYFAYNLGNFSAKEARDYLWGISIFLAHSQPLVKYLSAFIHKVETGEALQLILRG
jgi:hypothetical protein